MYHLNQREAFVYRSMLSYRAKNGRWPSILTVSHVTHLGATDVAEAICGLMNKRVIEPTFGGQYSIICEDPDEGEVNLG